MESPAPVEEMPIAEAPNNNKASPSITKIVLENSKSYAVVKGAESSPQFEAGWRHSGAASTPWSK